MCFEELRCFMSVAKNRSFTKAAQELYMAQPSLSKKIMQLEKALAVQLFIRTKRSVRLTEAGSVLFTEGAELLNHINTVIEKVKQMGEGHGENIRVAFLGAIDIDFLPVLNSFRKEYPTIKVELSSTNLRETYLLLDQGIADIIVSLDFGILTIPGIEVKKLYTDGLSLVVSANHWFIQLKTTDYSRLKDERFLLVSSQESPHIMNR